MPISELGLCSALGNGSTQGYICLVVETKNLRVARIAAEGLGQNGRAVFSIENGSVREPKSLPEPPWNFCSGLGQMDTESTATEAMSLQMSTQLSNGKGHRLSLLLASSTLTEFFTLAVKILHMLPGADLRTLLSGNSLSCKFCIRASAT